jgi:RNA polymerase subunit RPABC4/transcription elongation factor Spt4
MRVIGDIDYPLLWRLPFAAFTFVAFISLVNMLLNFLPETSGPLLMLIASGFICASVSSFITELVKGRGKYVYLSMSVAIIIGAISFLVASGFLKSNIITGPKMAVISPINILIKNVTLTILPGLFVGAIVGGGVGFFPEEYEFTEREHEIEKPLMAPDKLIGYEKACRKCGNVLPFDSLFCSRCGGTLKKRRWETMKYCRYCGKRLYFLGGFCPDCGKEINIVSKPKVFVSN